MNKVFAICYLIIWPVFRILLPNRTIGREHIPEGGALYCANHTRLNDPFYVVYALGWPHQIHIMAKEELLEIPVIGYILKKAGIFGVQRGKSDVGAIRTAMKYLKGGEQLLMFPEGTRHQDGEVGDAKTGAAMLSLRCGVPIVPVYVPPEKKWFRRTPVVIGEPYYPHVEGKKGTTEEYRAIAEDLMARIEALEAQAE